MTDEQIKHMVSRFLMWKLPEHFNPDAGISFRPYYPFKEDCLPHEWPVGTNVFSADQTDAMVRRMLEGMP